MEREKPALAVCEMEPFPSSLWSPGKWQVSPLCWSKMVTETNSGIHWDVSKAAASVSCQNTKVTNKTLGCSYPDVWSAADLRQANRRRWHHLPFVLNQLLNRTSWRWSNCVAMGDFNIAASNQSHLLLLGEAPRWNNIYFGNLIYRDEILHAL